MFFVPTTSWGIPVSALWKMEEGRHHINQEENGEKMAESTS